MTWLLPLPYAASILAGLWLDFGCILDLVWCAMCSSMYMSPMPMPNSEARKTSRFLCSCNVYWHSKCDPSYASSFGIFSLVHTSVIPLICSMQQRRAEGIHEFVGTFVKNAGSQVVLVSCALCSRRQTR